MRVGSKRYIIDEKILKQFEAFKCTLAMIEINIHEEFMPLIGGNAEHWLYMGLDGDCAVEINGRDFTHKLIFHYEFDYSSLREWETLDKFECRLKKVTINEYNIFDNNYNMIYSQPIFNDISLIERPLGRILTMLDIGVKKDEIKST